MSTFTLVLPGRLWPNTRGAHWADGVATLGWDWLLGHRKSDQAPRAHVIGWLMIWPYGIGLCMSLNGKRRG